MRPLKSFAFALPLIFAASLAQAQTNPPSTTVIESGKIRFYETHEIRGEENFQISQSSNGELVLQAKTDLPFIGEEKKPLVNTTLRTAKDLTPQSFAIKGSTLLDVEEDTSIIVQNNTATVQDLGQNKSVQLPPNFFTMSGYVPLTVEMMLVRYWLAHGRPASIALLPVARPS